MNDIRRITLGKSDGFQYRTLDINDPEPGRYVNNNVTTTKYTRYNFMAKNLMEQFSRIANQYFLVISILASLPISPKDHISLFGTFIAVLAISAVKEAYEDIQRDKSDNETNTCLCEVVEPDGNLVKKMWRDVHVGEILHVQKDEQIPADLVVLSTTDIEHGLCYVDTCNIDGETNLKTMNAMEYFKKTSEIGKLAEITGRIECEAPNASLYTFTGSLNLKPGATSETDANASKLSIGVSNVLLRGCVLRQTKDLYGVAIFTGHDTKLMQNASAAPFKVSYLMKVMNRCLFIVFAFQAAMCFSNTLFALEWRDSSGKFVKYVNNPNADSNFNFAVGSEMDIGFVPESYLTFLIAYGNLIPISLYVALEMVKVFQVS